MERALKIDKSDWILTKMGYLAKDVSQRVENPSESPYDRFVGLGNFVSGDLKIKTWETTESLASSAKAFQAGDVLFARRNAYLRRASMVDFDGCCSGDAFVLRENPEKLIPGFLTFIVNSEALWDYANSNAAGTMSKRVKWRDLANYEFLLPPKDQQAQLAELLWAMDAVVEREREVLERLSIVKQAQLSKTFLRENCDKLRISEICESLDNRRIPIKKSDRVSGPYPYYGASGVVDYVAEFLFDEPILLISEDGENLNSRKLPIAYLVDERCWVNNHAHVLKVVNASSYLLAEYFNFSDVSDFITGGTRPKITKSMLMDMPIYQPTQELAEEYEDKLRGIDSSSSMCRDKIAASQTLLHSFINQIF